MRRLFHCTVSLIYEDERVTASMTSPVAARAEFWWNERKPDERVLLIARFAWAKTCSTEIINHPVPLDPPSERISDFSAHQFSVNAYYDFLNDSRWTPYVGAGVG